MRAFRIAYEGRRFHGFQRQPDVHTVEDALLDALVALDVLDGPEPDARSRPVPDGYAAAGRTDAGVSALAQTVAFDAPDWLDPAALNAELPATVRAWASAEVSEDFHATRDAERRRYVYHLRAPAGSHRPGEGGPGGSENGGPGGWRDDEVARARDALDALAGEHDFANLTPNDEGTRRDLETDWTLGDPFLVLEFTAGGFPRQFVRRAAGLVELVASGERPLAFVDRVLDPAPVAGPDGVPTAPPEPLVLVDVEYPDVEFDPASEGVGGAAADGRGAAADARAAFRERREAAETRARVAGRIERGVGGETPDREP